MLKCDICGEEFFSQRMLDKHWQGCIKPKPEASYGVIEMPAWDFGLFGWLWVQLLRFIDWLNDLFGADQPKPKSKHTTEQMATLDELFEGYEELPEPSKPRVVHKQKPPSSYGTIKR
jgi:hypothetical protein